MTNVTKDLLVIIFERSLKSMLEILNVQDIKALQEKIKFTSRTENNFLKLRNQDEGVYITARQTKNKLKIVIGFMPPIKNKKRRWWNYLDNARLFDKYMDKITCNIMTTLSFTPDFPSSFSIYSEFKTKNIAEFKIKHILIHTIIFD